MDYEKTGDLGFQSIDGEEFSVEALAKEFAGMSQEEIYSEGTRCSSDMLDFLIENVESPAEFYTNVMLTGARAACGADGRFQDAERELAVYLLQPIQEVMGGDVEALVDQVADEERLEKLRKTCEDFADKGEDGRKFARNLARLMMCFVAVDGHIDGAEFNVIEKLFKEVFDKLGTYSLFAAMGINL